MASPQIDPFSGVMEVRLLYSMDLPLPGQFKAWDARGQPLGCFRRDGPGLRAFQMNFALEDSEGRALLLVRRPAPRHWIRYGGAWAVETPGGERIGELDWSARQRATLTLDRGATYSARVPGWSWKGYSIRSGSLPVASISLPNPFVPRPGNPGGVRLEIAPGLTGSADHKFLVLLAGFIGVFRPPPGWPQG